MGQEGERLTLNRKRLRVWYSAMSSTVCRSFPKREGDGSLSNVASKPWETSRRGCGGWMGHQGVGMGGPGIRDRDKGHGQGKGTRTGKRDRVRDKGHGQE